MRWEEVEEALDAYEAAWFLVPTVAVGGTLAVLGLLALTNRPGLLVLLPVPALLALAYESSIAFRCPWCAKAIQRGRDGTQLLLARNLHQCPHCQRPFEDGPVGDEISSRAAEAPGPRPPPTP